MASAIKSILCVEDDQDIANLLRLVLRQAPAELAVVDRIEEPLAQIDQRVPDLILLDLMLPQMTGLDLLEKLQADERVKQVPVIVVTVRTDTAHRERARELGVRRYIVKPFSPAVLRREIESALGVDWKMYW